MPGTLPPMRALQAFEAVGRLGSVTKAAVELGVTAGAVSQQVKLLERHLGCALISRQGRQIGLTSIGALYHPQIEAGFSAITEAGAALQRQQVAAGLVVSALPSFLIRWLSSRIFRWQEHNPAIRLRLESTPREPDLERDGIDFRVAYGKNSAVHRHTRCLFTDRVVPVCSPDFLEKHRNQLRTPEGLCEVELIHIDWRPEFDGAPSWEDWFQLKGVTARISTGTSYSLTTLALEAAVRGQGIALGQLNFIQKELVAGQLVRPFDIEMSLSEPYFVAWSPIALEKPGGRDFLNWILSVPVQ